MGTILVNVDSLTPAEDDILRRAIHHEIYHVIEANLLPPASIDLEWEQLNPRGFQYGGEEILEALDVTHQSPGQRTEIPGLLNYYCMVSAGEDRAELFSTLMVHPDELHAQGASDEILLKKLAYLKLRLMAISREFELMLRHNGVGH